MTWLNLVELSKLPQFTQLLGQVIFRSQVVRPCILPVSFPIAKNLTNKDKEEKKHKHSILNKKLITEKSLVRFRRIDNVQIRVKNSHIELHFALEKKLLRKLLNGALGLSCKYGFK